MLASQDERYINIVKIEDKPGQCPGGVVFIFYKNYGRAGHCLVIVRGYSESRGLQGLYKLLGKEGESGWVSACNYYLRKNVVKIQSSQQLPENDCGKPLGPLK